MASSQMMMMCQWFSNPRVAHNSRSFRATGSVYSMPESLSSVQELARGWLANPHLLAPCSSLQRTAAHYMQ